MASKEPPKGPRNPAPQTKPHAAAQGETARPPRPAPAPRPKPIFTDWAMI